MIVFRQKYPRWWFDFNLELARFSTRVCAYLALMSDTYPSTDEQQSVRLDIDYPNVEQDLNRWLPLVKWLLAIPHYIVLFFLLSPRSLRSSSPGSPCCSPDATREPSSTSSKASCDGGFVSRHTPSCLSPTATHPSRSSDRPVRPQPNDFFVERLGDHGGGRVPERRGPWSSPAETGTNATSWRSSRILRLEAGSALPVRRSRVSRTRCASGSRWFEGSRTGAPLPLCCWLLPPLDLQSAFAGV